MDEFENDEVPGGPAFCRLCGSANDCGAATGAGWCWCFAAAVSKELRAFMAAHGLDDACLCPRCAAGDVPSPCTDRCALDAAGRRCTGCSRTLAEIARWPEMSAVERAAVLLRLKGAGAQG